MAAVVIADQRQRAASRSKTVEVAIRTLAAPEELVGLVAVGINPGHSGAVSSAAVQTRGPGTKIPVWFRS